MKKNILVTGAAGFIGSHLSERLLDRGDRVIAVDNFSDFYSPDIKRRNIEKCLNDAEFNLYEMDIEDLSLLMKVFDDENVDIIVHLAARAGVRPSIKNPSEYMATNGVGTVNLLEAARKNNINRFVFGSSSSVYGINKKGPFKETDNVNLPISPYAATKIADELMCYTYHYLYGMKMSCLRFFTVYGPRQRPDLAICKFARYIKKDKPIPVFGDGTTSRDYTFIDDILKGVVAAIDKPFDYEIFNLGESRMIVLQDLIALLEENLGKKVSIDTQSFQPGDVPVTYADISKAKEMLGYDPQVTIEEGIKRFTDWFSEQEDSFIDLMGE